MLETLADVVENVPGGGVGPLHLVEQEDEGTLLRHEAHVLAQLVEKAILASPTCARRGRIRSEQAHQVMQLPPRPGRLAWQAMQRADERGPDSVRLAHALLARPPHDERAAAEAHLRLETSHERGRSGSSFAENGDGAR